MLILPNLSLNPLSFSNIEESIRMSYERNMSGLFSGTVRERFHILLIKISSI
jgi:hypothetical protein